MDGAGNIAVCRMERLKGRAAGEFDLLEMELPKLSFLNFTDDAAVAFDAGSAKFSHFFSPFFSHKFIVGNRTIRPKDGANTAKQKERPVRPGVLENLSPKPVQSQRNNLRMER